MTYTAKKIGPFVADACDDCGALVSDQELHDRWHTEQNNFTVRITPEFIDIIHRGLLRKKRKAGGRHLGLT